MTPMPLQRSSASRGTPEHDELPAADAEREQLGERALRRPAARRQDRDAAAQRLGVRQHVRAEEHGAAAIAQRQDQLANIAPAERIEPRHRLVEEDDLGLVDQRLRDADALQHPFRELPQLQPALGADPDLVEQPRRTARGARRRRSQRGRRSSRAAPPRSGNRRSTDSPAGSRSGA